eukprot:85991-Prorocentrum_minimum.AAC.1
MSLEDQEFLLPAKLMPPKPPLSLRTSKDVGAGRTIISEWEVPNRFSQPVPLVHLAELQEEPVKPQKRHEEEDRERRAAERESANVPYINAGWSDATQARRLKRMQVRRTARRGLYNSTSFYPGVLSAPLRLLTQEDP